MSDLAASPLGHATTYSDHYDPALLFPVEREPQRGKLGIGVALPFFGEDVWTAYELSWLDPRGKPEVAIATLRVPVTSPRIVESKSMKLYVTAFNQTRFEHASAVRDTIARDLAGATGSTVTVELTAPDAFRTLPHAEPEGVSLDALPLSMDDYVPCPEALATGDQDVAETLYTRLFRSLCPVTGQPDYASVVVRYEGRAIDHLGLLRYLVSYRRDPGFHEHCVERIFIDVARRCAPRFLSVHARFTRRGGIDINPYRSSAPMPAPVNARTARQ